MKDANDKAIERIKADICVIGAGSGGLSVAAGAAQMGASVVLIEKHKMGGDCLNTGCVPSKALIAAARAAHAPRISSAFGVDLAQPAVDFARVHRHVHNVIGGIAPHDSAARFEGLGVRVIREAARFVSPTEVRAGRFIVKARRFVAATGSVPVIPAVPGLDTIPHLTNETIFDLKELPGHLIVLGGGPIGIEMAQAFRRLGSEVSLFEISAILPRDEPEAADVVRRALTSEGVRIYEGASIKALRQEGVNIELTFAQGSGAGQSVTGTHMLVAAGRKANIEGLDLHAGGIAASSTGIKVDARLRTTNRRVFAIGDCSGGPQFTHAAGYQAGIVIRNALFAMPAKADYAALPWVTYTDPELAHVGLTEASARAAGHAPKILSWPFEENDRARAELRTEGMAKIVLGRNGKILGATIVGAHAGELIGLWGLAISAGVKISKIAGMIAPYPTLSEVSKRAAGSYYTPSLFSPRIRKLVKFIQRFVP
jgi:pyruvate/2-oxoglutarate dehydrogenase complex dihydrolipoamide dehydrogenase (E3) component